MLVHDYLLVMRGAERTFAAMADLWPRAPIATLLYDPEIFDERLATHPIRTSPLQRLGARQGSFKALMPAFPKAAERLDVSGHDLVVSSSSAFAHGVRPDDRATHVCYCHTPFRYAWYERENGIAQAPRLTRPLVEASLNRIRAWDRRAVRPATHYIANGRITQQRMADLWGVEAPVLHPPVQTERFASGEPEDFFLIVCELVRHKRVDITLEAARIAGVHVKVVGGGADLPRLELLHGDHAEFLGRLADDELVALYPRAQALIMANVEEFGITAVETQAAGRPVVAARAGGALETVREGVTGIFFPPDDIKALAEVLRETDFTRFDSDACRASAERFSTKAFASGFHREVASALGS